MKVLLVTPIFMRTEKTLSFLSSLIGKDYEGLDLRLALGVNRASERLLKGIYDWKEKFEAAHRLPVKVVEFENNQGKGKALNHLVKVMTDGWEPDYICSLDSDVIQVEFRWLKRMLGCFESYAHEDGRRLGLVSPNHLNDMLSVNIHDIQPRNQIKMKVGEDHCMYSPDNSGIAGPCFLVAYEAWKAVGGYYDALYIGGNDAYMLQDLHRVGYRAIIDLSLFIMHPRPLPSEEGYVAWKYDMVMTARKKPASLPPDKRDFKPADWDMT